MKLFAALVLGLFSNLTSAKVVCPPAKVQMLHIKDDVVYIQLEGVGSWHVLAEAGEKDYDKKLARAEKAKRKDREVELTFPNGYDDTCRASNINVTAKKIKLMKRKKKNK